MYRCLPAILLFIAPVPAAPAPPDRAQKEWLAEMSVPVVARHETGAADRKWPDLPAIDLKVYAAKPDAKSKVRKAVRAARLALWACSADRVPPELAKEVTKLRADHKINLQYLRTRIPLPPGNREAPFKTRMFDVAKELARPIAMLEEVEDSLRKLGDARDKEPKRWQAHLDLVRACVLVRIVQLSEMQLALSRMRKEGLPAYDARKHKAWQMNSALGLSDSAAKKLAKEAAQLFALIVRNYPATPWATLAETARKVPLGVEWKAVK